MPRQKGDGRGRNGGGRQKGTPNKATSSMRDWLQKLFDKNKKQVMQDLEALDPKSRLEALAKFLPYLIPKQQAVAASVDLHTLTDEQLDSIVEQITANLMDYGSNIES